MSASVVTSVGESGFNTAIFNQFQKHGERTSWSPDGHKFILSCPGGVPREPGYVVQYRDLRHKARPLDTIYKCEKYPRITQMKSVEELRARIAELGLVLPIDRRVHSASDFSPLSKPILMGNKVIGNSLCVQPMEGTNAYKGCDKHVAGSPTPRTLRSWIFYGLSGAKLIWGGEAAAVLPEGRANPRQTLVTPENADGIKALNDICRYAHAHKYGEAALEDFVVGLQLTYSGRNNRPTDDGPAPKVMFHHKLYDPEGKAHVLSDGELENIINAYVRAAGIAKDAGFDFVDIKACHGYLLHESLGAFTRSGDYGGESLKNRSRSVSYTHLTLPTICSV